MISLAPNECRVLGVLVEKALTTPAQYPLTLNALVTGCNQKNNRDPVTNLDESAVLDALDGLRQKGLALHVDMTGSRVPKYRQVAREALSVDTPQLVVLTELLLRGPQTLGELRGRASRMHMLESLDTVQNVLNALMQRPEPLVRELPPAPGTRAERFVQLLCPNLHPLDAPGTVGTPAAAPGGAVADAANVAPLAAGAPAAADPVVLARLEELETRVAKLTTALRNLAAKLGETDPLGGV